ncbi:NADH dehydrogenase, alpha subcomplex, subunit 6 [Tilletiopsis washingtonensis]|uniref:NADH dehydrogenase, alpha subcomplex, subunit 6 n=1 Tax=Tilletiopsis washingtonensis TaxID=58919 RepID=A0A316ZJM4_9BASI|nr:NADH dehydrogenase, alpha subcomplex, subunit 6 [Tilletiopsis washingtonensis]PWO01285.1 NADH dehydrogenase, alpha subcomplex, subunit 6 [Tilletiopsis washingtonensis]
MTTIPARLAQTTRISGSLAESHARARSLYRNYFRSAPELCALYALDVPPSVVRAKLRQKFEAHRHVRDIAVLDVMLFKAHIEYQETMNAWKQVPHIMRWFAEEEAAPTPQTFLEKFYAGRDEGRTPTGQGN